MSGFAKVNLIGNLGKDPELKFTTGGTAVCNLRVGCTERVKVKDEWKDATEWVSLVCFGKTAENAGQYLQKGRQIYAEGRLQTREWNDKDGNKRYSTEVICNQLTYLGKGEGVGKSGGAQPAAGGSTDSGPPLSDDELPF
jgi:single-strand DNA-binding protein